MDIYLAGPGGQRRGLGRAGRRCSGGPRAAGGAVSPRNSARRPPPSSARPPPRQLLKCRLYGSITAPGRAALVLTEADRAEGAFSPLIPEIFPALFRRQGGVLPPGHAQCTRGESKAWTAPRTHRAFIILKIPRHLLLCDRDGWNPGTEVPAPLFLPCPKPLLFPLKPRACGQGILISRRAGVKWNIGRKGELKGSGRMQKGLPGSAWEESARKASPLELWGQAMDFPMPLSARRGWDSRAGNRHCCKNLVWKLFTGGWKSSTAVFDTNKKPCLCPKQFQLCGTRCDYITQMWEGWCSANLTRLSKSFLTCSRRLFCFLESFSYFFFFPLCFCWLPRLENGA